MLRFTRFMIVIIIIIRPLTTDRFDSPKPASFFTPSREARTPFDDTPLNDARRRAERVITNDDSFFDVRGARVPKSSVGDGINQSIREFDDEVFVDSFCFSILQHTLSFTNNVECQCLFFFVPSLDHSYVSMTILNCSYYYFL